MREPAPIFRAFLADVLDERERAGIRGVSQERHRARLHVATAPFADKPIDQIWQPDVAAWIREMQAKTAADRRGARKLSRQTIQRCMALASAVFVEAGPQGRGWCVTNPCHGMKVKAGAAEGATREPWTFLTLEEQRAIEACAELADADRWAILFAVGTGLRQGEQFALLLEDLHVDGPEPRVVVRYGSKGKPPKSGKIRTVPLFGLGLRAARAWLELLPTFAPRNPEGLVFPLPNGRRRAIGKPLGNRRGGACPWRSALRLVGVERRVRWHDLRHTCASSLVTGAWGRRWTLEEIQPLMGHSSIMITQRYSHVGETTLKAAARETATKAPSIVDALRRLARRFLGAA